MTEDERATVAGVAELARLALPSDVMSAALGRWRITLSKTGSLDPWFADGWGVSAMGDTPTVAVARLLTRAREIGGPG